MFGYPNKNVLPIIIAKRTGAPDDLKNLQGNPHVTTQCSTHLNHNINNQSNPIHHTPIDHMLENTWSCSITKSKLLYYTRRVKYYHNCPIDCTGNESINTSMCELAVYHVIFCDCPQLL